MHESDPEADDPDVAREYRTVFGLLSGIGLNDRRAQWAVRTGWRARHLDSIWVLAQHSRTMSTPLAGPSSDELDRFWILHRCGGWLHREFELSGDDALPWLATVASTRDPDVLADLVEAISVGAAWFVDVQDTWGPRAALGWAAGLADDGCDTLAGRPDGELKERAAARGILLPDDW